jgi:hypothetical protein
VYAAVFAVRTAWQLARTGDPGSAARQTREALRCLRLLAGGVPEAPGRLPAVDQARASDQQPTRA